MGLSDYFRPKESILGSGILKGADDCHSHLLYGVDDGMKTLEQSLEALTYLESAGISQLWCTPHIMEDIPNTTEALKLRFEELQSAYKGPIVLHLAAEYMLDTLFKERLESDDLLLHSGNMLLVETSTNVPPYNFRDMLEKIISKGYCPLLAHPERYRYLEMVDYEVLKRSGVHFQLNLPSLVGAYGDTARKKSWQCLKEGWYESFGSDCHRLRNIVEQYQRVVLPGSVSENLAYVKSGNKI